MTRAAIVAIVACVGACSLDLDALRGDAPTAEAEPDPSPEPSPSTDASPPPPVDGGTLDAPVLGSTCGRLGAACCLPGSRCDEGACLRGRCAAFAGVFGSMSGCAPDCRARNPYTAGCSCPLGFSATPTLTLVGTCDGADGSASLSMCTTPPDPRGSDFQGAYVATRAGACDSGCIYANGHTGDCSCPPESVAMSMRIEIPASCGGTQPAILGLCRREGAPTITFAGAWQTDADGGCAIVNPTTGTCACDPEAMEQTLPTVPEPIHLCLT